MFVCLSVGMWRANGNPNPWTDIDEIFHAYPTCPRKVLVQVWPPPPSPPGLETLKAEGHIFKMLTRLQINLGSAGYLSLFCIIFFSIF